MRNLYLHFATALFLSVGLTAQNHSLDFQSSGNNRVSLTGLNLTGAFTIEAWVKPNEKTDFSTILSNKEGGGSNPGFTFAINQWQTNNRKLILETKGVAQATDNAVIAWGVWQHVAITYDGSVAIFYVNGSVAPSSGSVVLETSSLGTYIGDWANYVNDGNYDGVMDELRVWSVARTQSEIQNNMNGELSGTPAGLTAYYKFNHGTNPGGNNSGQTSLTDHAGGDNNGTLLNFTLSSSRSNWIAESPLPVELTAFYARLSENNVTLHWKTASELNNKGFEVERSADSRQWSRLTFVPGNGTTHAEQSYHYTDTNPVSGINYYRLRQVDFDGRHEYSKIVVVEQWGNVSSLAVSPNPAKERLLCSLRTDYAGAATLTLLGLDGKPVITRPVVLQGGPAQFEFALENVQPGMYFVSLQLGHELLQERLMVR